MEVCELSGCEFLASCFLRALVRSIVYVAAPSCMPYHVMILNETFCRRATSTIVDVDPVMIVIVDLVMILNECYAGATSTIVDVVGTMALLSQDPTKPGVTVEMSTSFIAAAKSGTTVRIEGKVLKSGARLGFTQVAPLPSSFLFCPLRF